MYVDRGDPTSDSKKARIRLGSYIDGLRNHNLTGQLKLRGGYTHRQYSNFEAHFSSAPITEILDSITLIFEFLAEQYCSGQSFVRDHEDLRNFVGAVFAEENLHYTIDRDGYIHPTVDQEFAQASASILRGLGREPAIKKEVEHCYAELAKVAPTYKIAARAMFEALEILVKRMASTSKLDSTTVRGELAKIVAGKLGTDDTSRLVCQKTMASFASWVDSAHFYRHGQKDDDPVDIPAALAIQIISAGASYLRMLLDVNSP